MSETGLERTNKKPFLVVEGDNLITLMAVAKVVNESGLKCKVLMEYEVCRYEHGVKIEDRSENVHDGGKQD